MRNFLSRSHLEGDLLRMGVSYVAGATFLIIALAMIAWQSGVASYVSVYATLTTLADPSEGPNGGVPPPNFSAYATELLNIGALMSANNGSPIYWQPAISELMPPELKVSDGPAKVGDGLGLLLFGDSVDRMIVTEGCLNYGGMLDTTWGHEVFTYPWAPGSGFCKADWGTLGFVHLFGARPTGPYFHNMNNNNTEGHMADTVLRLEFGLRHYKDSFGVFPNVVVYQANLWDGQKYGWSKYNDVAKRLRSVHQFFGDIERNCEQILDILPSSSILLLRTTPPGKIPFTDEFNHVLGLVARKKSIGLLDWAAMTAGVKDRRASFRDDKFHPTEPHTRGFASTLVRFSTFLLNRTYVSSVVSEWL